jgi:hypothetical protein
LEALERVFVRRIDLDHRLQKTPSLGAADGIAERHPQRRRAVELRRFLPRRLTYQRELFESLGGIGGLTGTFEQRSALEQRDRMTRPLLERCGQELRCILIASSGSGCFGGAHQQRRLLEWILGQLSQLAIDRQRGLPLVADARVGAHLPHGPERGRLAPCARGVGPWVARARASGRSSCA